MSSAFIYKKVANKTQLVTTSLPEDFRIVHHKHPDPLGDMRPLPVRPPEFSPTSQFTQERCDHMALGKGFLLPEESVTCRFLWNLGMARNRRSGGRERIQLIAIDYHAATGTAGTEYKGD